MPWSLTGWRLATPLFFWGPFRMVGVLLITAGGLVLVNAFVRFVLEGVGTPAPVAPTRQLVVSGPYRHVRNPMYLAVVAAIIGQALLLGQLGLAVYAGAVGMLMAAFARWVEEPGLRERFSAEYQRYCREVPVGGRGFAPGINSRRLDRERLRCYRRCQGRTDDAVVKCLMWPSDDNLATMSRLYLGTGFPGAPGRGDGCVLGSDAVGGASDRLARTRQAG